MIATGCPPLDRAVYRIADIRIEGCSIPVDGHRAAYAPRRYLLDGILADAAVAAGVEFRQGCTVTEVLSDDEGQAIGVRCHTSDGGTTEEHARLVVGADGMRSRFATMVDSRITTEDPPATCAYYTYWEGVTDRFELYEAPGRWVGTVPTNDNTTLIAAYFPQSEFERVRKDAMGAYLEAVRSTAPELYAKIASQTPLERLHGTGDQRNYFREAAGLGWALVGDMRPPQGLHHRPRNHRRLPSGTAAGGLRRHRSARPREAARRAGGVRLPARRDPRRRLPLDTVGGRPRSGRAPAVHAAHRRRGPGTHGPLLRHAGKRHRGGGVLHPELHARQELTRP